RWSRTAWGWAVAPAEHAGRRLRRAVGRGCLRGIAVALPGECKDSGREHLLETPMRYGSWRISLLRLGLGLVGFLLLTPKDTKYFLQGVLFLVPVLSRRVPGLSGCVRRPLGVRLHHDLPVRLRSLGLPAKYLRSHCTGGGDRAVPDVKFASI